MLGKKWSLLSISLLSLSLIWVTGCGGSPAAIGVSITSTTTTVDGADTVNITASVANDRNAAGVSWTVSGGGTLSNTTTTSATYTAPSATTSAQTATVTATSVADTTKTVSATITVPAKPAVTTTGVTLAATVGAAYSVQLTGNGGISPYTWTVSSGTLPPCLSMSTGGLITGTVTAACAGTYSPVFTVTDSGTPTKLTATSTLNMTIAAASAIGFTGAVPGTATYNVAFAGSVAAGGGAGTLTYSKSGTWPAWLGLNASTGAIAGTPNAVGTFSFGVTASDAFGDSASQSYTVVVSYPTLVVSPVGLPTGYAGSSYAQTTLAATGGNGGPYAWTWAAAGGSSIPAGLSLSAGGLITGSPTTAGSYSVVATATDSANNTGSLTLAITIKSAVSINAITLAAGYAGSTYSQTTFGAAGGTGGPYTWTWAAAGGSSIPAGLSLSSGGVITGTPTTAGAYSIQVTATDSANNTANLTVPITINAGVSITPPTISAGYPGASYPATTFTASGGTNTGFTWSWAAAGGSTLPFGLSIGSTTGTISGTPTNSTSSNVVSSVVVTATDSIGNKATTTVSITIEASVAITTSTLIGGTVNSAYSQQLTASGGAGTGYTWMTTGLNNLSSFGLSVSSTGLLSSTNLGASTGTVNFTAQATDSQGHSTTASLSFTVFAALTVTTASLPATNVGAGYLQTLTAGGGSGGGYTWTATASNLASFGLSLSSAGVITGTPTQSGSATFTANVKDSSNNTALQALSITVYSALSLPAPDPSSLPSSGYTNVAYSGSINASGGSGTYCWKVTGLPSDNLTSPLPNAPCGYVASSLPISGTPGATPTTVTFSVTLTDVTTNASVTQTGYSVIISNPTPVTLPTPSSTNPGTATQNQSYNGSITVSGGVAPYTWSINGTTVTGAGLTLGDNLTATSSGGSSLTITGTPTTITTVNLTNVKVTDSLGSNQTNSYSIAVNSAGSNVSGHLSLTTNCGNGTVPTIMLSLLTNPGGTVVQTQTTDGSGNFTFTGIVNGNYTVVPSISGPTSVFYPANYSVAVNNSVITGENFGVSLGYTVSGTVSYSGANTGRIYLALNNTTCSGSGGPGTSISSPGAFTIRGVPPGSYNLQAYMDLSTLANGAQNTSDPAGSAAATVVTSNLTGAGVTLADNTPTSVPSSNPTINAITPTDQGVAISFKAVTIKVNGNQVEAATSYDVQWSTSPTFSTSPVIHNFKAVGTSSNVWILNNGTSGVAGSPFTNGTPYYFEVRARNAAGPASTWTVYGGGTPSGVSPGASTSGIQVQGTVTIPSGITPNGPLYVGFYNMNTNTIYGARIAAPIAGANAYTVYVPSDSSPDYFSFAILDQNNDGLIDAGDVTNTDDKNLSSISITAPLIGQDPSLPASSVTVAVSTQYYQSTHSGGSSNGYSLNFNVRRSNKLPVAVTLTSGPNTINPLDISACTTCGNAQFQYNADIGGVVPSVGDTYNFTVTYSDGSQDTGSAVNGQVTAFGSTGAIVGAADLVTNLSPSATSSTSTTPTFTWTYPTGSSTANYLYSFYMSDNSGNTVWQIPGNNSNYNGFTYAQDSAGSLTWGTDPIPGDNSTPNGNLNTTTYNWQIQVQDSNGNSAQTQTWYQP